MTSRKDSEKEHQLEESISFPKASQLELSDEDQEIINSKTPFMKSSFDVENRDDDNTNAETPFIQQPFSDVRKEDDENKDDDIHVIFSMDNDDDIHSKQKYGSVTDSSGKRVCDSETLQKQKTQLVGPFEIFRYASVWDKVLMVVGSLCAAANGAAFPFMMIVFAKAIEYFVKFGKLDKFLPHARTYLDLQNVSKLDVIKNPLLLDEPNCEELSNFYQGNLTCPVFFNKGVYDRISEFAVYICRCVVLVSGYGQIVLWVHTSEKQAKRIRHLCLFNVLHQNVGWFDMHNSAELNDRMSNDIAKIQEGLGDKLSTLVQWFTTAITCFIVGFAYGWKLSFVILAMCPVTFFVTGAMNKLASALTVKELEEYAKAGAIAEEILGAIRTVTAFGGQEKEAQRYKENLDNARVYGIKKGIIHGLSIGAFWMIIFCCNGLGFWYGGRLHRDEPDNYSTSTVITVFVCVLFGAYALGNTVPSLQTFAEARGAAYVVFNLIEMVSPINSSLDQGCKPNSLKGAIQIKNVHFTYPSRPDVKVLQGLDIEALPGQTVALVGASGCGKSTVVQLLLRFYNPDQGQILLDGLPVEELNVGWLRKNIGLVGQEPVLFATSIAENIRYGKDNVSMDDIIQAAKDANAYNFIMELPDKFQTFVGEQGAQLSGGQKQRIAIARALVRDPKILLLDEATSALDTESESIVQDALDKARKGRTTFVIAHRLSTIKTADVIIGIQGGQLVESGSHEELMNSKGFYYQLVMNQMSAKQGDTEEKNIDETSHEVKSELVKNISCDESTDKNKEGDENLLEAPFTRLLKMNMPEWYFIVLGCLGSLINGCILPAFAVVFSGVMYVFSDDTETQKEEFRKFAFIFVAVGASSLVTYFLQSSMFGFSGEALTQRVRNLSFRSMLKQDVSWFDDRSHSVGALTTRLATDASQVQGVTGVRLGAMLMSVSTVVSAFAIGFIYGWKMTLVLLAFLPFMAVGDFIKIRMFAGQSTRIKMALEKAGKLTVESIGNIRTIAALGKEQTFFSMYMKELEGPFQEALKTSHVVGIAFCFSQSAVYFFYATAFVFGAFMIEEGDMDSRDVFRVFCAVVFGALGLGDASAFAPDFGKAQASAKRILQIIDSKPSIDYTDPSGDKLADDYSADVTFKDVHFHYPTRQSVSVLRGLNLSVTSGQTLALVGSSGCGKSTTVQLIERFYDALSGTVFLAKQDIRSLNVEWLRGQMALVSQEPVLFDQTVAENIAYGDNSRTISMDEIIQAAKTSNIHDFIASLPLGYSTRVGAKGTQLSGGQKQRIAIARALIRNPKILLLDEATSALDTESEKIVQDALDKASSGRTCVVIAHRLSTIQNADKICVISQGEVIEQGTHQDLLALKGFYHTLHEKATRKK